jgi:predicted nuclease of restriction endonuclease-like (RecB) superfamily
MVIAYWQIGKKIVEEEQKGKSKATYGVALLKELSLRLTADFGKGYSETNLKYFRQFYITFSPIENSHSLRDESLQNTIQKSHALRNELSWTHYRLLMRVENPLARNYYIQEAISQNWSTRALERQINSFYYERIISSKSKKVVFEEAKKNTSQLAYSPEDFIKDPYVLEFLNIPSDSGFLEKDLEKAIINKLQQFMLEMGKGFSFVAQQKRISAEDEHFYVDLVFYNYILKCFVLIDLKLGKLNHQDIGQMDLYVRWFEDNMRNATDNPTIGIILCSEKNETIVKYSILKESKQLFTSRYKLYLPTEEEFKKELETGILQFKLEN